MNSRRVKLAALGVALTAAMTMGQTCDECEVDGDCNDGNPCTIDTCVDMGGCLAAGQVQAIRSASDKSTNKVKECVHEVDPGLCDEFCSTAAATISYLGQGPFDICLASGTVNATVMVDQPPYTTGVDINTEMTALELTGNAPGLGAIRIYEDPDIASLGVVTNVVADGGGNFVSGDSSFDVFIRIDILGGAVTLVPCGGVPIHMESPGITSLPPLGSTYISDFELGETIPLCELVSGTPVGDFHHAQHEVCEPGQTQGSC